MNGVVPAQGAQTAGRGGSRVGLVVLIAGVTAFLSPVCPAAGPLTVAEYRAGLSRAREMVIAALRARQTETGWATTRGRLTAMLPAELPVRLSAGQTVTVDNRTLLQQLDGVPPAIRRARLVEVVAALDRRLAATEPRPLGLDRAHAGQALRQVLSRPEFRPKEEGPTAWDRFAQWLADLLQRLFPNAPRAAGGGEGLGRIMAGCVVLLLAMLLARILLLVLPELRRRRRHEDPDLPAGELLVPSEPEALLAEAERAAAAGRFREALRLAYRATVVRLDRAGVLPEDRSRTHWELLRELRRAGRDPLYRELAPLTRRLDERLYGGRAATVEDYQACRATHDQIERLLCAPA